MYKFSYINKPKKRKCPKGRCICEEDMFKRAVCSDVKVNGSPYCDPMCSRNDRHLGKVLKTGGCKSLNTCCMSDCQICLKPMKACPTKDTSKYCHTYTPSSTSCQSCRKSHNYHSTTVTTLQAL